MYHYRNLHVSIMYWIYGIVVYTVLENSFTLPPSKNYATLGLNRAYANRVYGLLELVSACSILFIPFLEFHKFIGKNRCLPKLALAGNLSCPVKSREEVKNMGNSKKHFWLQNDLAFIKKAHMSANKYFIITSNI